MAGTDDKVNPYELLGLSIEASLSEIKSAYRKISLKVHPDRHPNNPDAAHKFHELNQAYESLLDPIQRNALDAEVRLKEERKKRYAKFDSKRKHMQEELELREKAHKKSRDESVNEKRKREQENEAIKEEGRRMREEREKAAEKVKADRDREHQLPQDQPEALGPLDTTIRLKFPTSQYPSLVTVSALSAHLKQHRFGQFDEGSIVLSMKAPKKVPGKPAKYVTALIPFENVADAFAAVCAAGQERRGMKDMEASWASGKEPEVVKKLNSRKTGDEKTSPKSPQTKSFSSFAPNMPPSYAAPNPAGLDFESVTLMRLRQAERERLEKELREEEEREEQGD